VLRTFSVFFKLCSRLRKSGTAIGVFIFIRRKYLVVGLNNCLFRISIFGCIDQHYIFINLIVFSYIRHLRCFYNPFIVKVSEAEGKISAHHVVGIGMLPTWRILSVGPECLETNMDLL
jgi:hypothetical protein